MKFKILSLFFITTLAYVLCDNQIQLDVYKFNKIKYLDYTEFIVKNNLRNTFYPTKNKYEFSYKNNFFYFSPFSEFCKVNDNIYNMIYPALYKDSKLYLPIASFYKIIQKEGLPFKIVNFSNGHLTSSTQEFNIKDLNVINKSNGTLISLQTTTFFNKHNIATSLQKNGWLNITFSEGLIDSVNIASTKLSYPVDKIKIIQMENAAQLSVLLLSDNENVTVNTNKSSINILLQTSIDENINKINEIRKQWLIDTIVLDAGHGGKDPGAIGNSLEEKNIVLDITKRLGGLLERNLDVNVVYTREEDIFIPLKERTKIANDSGGKLFISIHVNSHAKEYINGFETYLLQSDGLDEAIEVAIRENSVIDMAAKTENTKESSNESRILANLMQNAYMKESEELAVLIQKHMAINLTARDRGIKQAGFHVLEGASMPNVLIEVGFLSNIKEAKNLNKAKYRKTIAEAIFSAIKEFKNNYDSQILNETQ